MTRHELLGEALVAAEVARRAAGAEAQPSRLDDLQAGGEAADRPHDGLERPGVAIGIVVEQHDVGAALLGLAAALPDGHALGGRRRRAGDDPVGVEHDGRDVPAATPAATTGQSGHHTVTIRRAPPSSRHPTGRSTGLGDAGRRASTAARSTVATRRRPGPGSHSSARRGRGTRRPEPRR